MKFVAAYLLACLGAEAAAATAAAEATAAADTEEGPAVIPAPAPTKDDVRRILGSVGAEVEEDRLDLLFALMEDKCMDIAELIAVGREQLAYAPSGAAAAATAVVAAPGAAAAAEAEEEAKKEEEEEEEDVGLFNLFD